MSDFFRARTRRWMLRSAGGAALAAVAVAAETIAKPAPASAADGGNVILGTDNTETGSTIIDNGAAGQIAFEATVKGDDGWGVEGVSMAGFGVAGLGGLPASTQFNTITGVTGSSTSGIGVQGCSDSNWGVYAVSGSNTGLQAGSTSGDAVVATSVSGSGVYAQSGATDGFAVTRDAVRGFTDSATAAGVRGENAAGGPGVSGVTTSTGAAGYPAIDGTNDGTGPGVHGTSFGGTGVVGFSTSGNGVNGTSTSAVGVFGASHSHWGVQAASDTDTALQAQSKGGIGVVGVGTASGVYGQSGATNGFALTRDGVRGFTDSATAAGVRGENAGGGPGLSGAGKTGVLAQAKGAGATALQVAGPAVFSRSGEVTIEFPAASTTVPVPGGLTAHALVLAQLQTPTPGVFVVSSVPNPATGKVTISLNKAPGTRVHPLTAKVAWFVIN